MKADKVLIVGNGFTARELLPHKEALKNFFDAIIILNGAFKLFDDIATHHLVVEKKLLEQEELNKGNFRPDYPRLINYKAMPNFNPKYNLQEITRSQLPENFNPREFIPTNNKKGLLIGRPNERGVALGSVTLCSIHLAAILGASRVYLAGVDFRFFNEWDHATMDKVYTKPTHDHPDFPKATMHNGIPTTTYMRDSAPVIDEHLTTTFKDLVVYDFSEQGLLTKTIKLNFNTWLKGINGE